MKAMRKYESAEYEAEQIEKRKNRLLPPKELKSMGRAPKYSPEELYTHAQNYFEQCENTVVSTDKNGNVIKKPKTRSGLCLYLKVGKDYIAQKDSDEKYKQVIEYIRQTTANNLEEGMLTGQYNASGAIFSLKHHEKWQDKVVVDSTVDNNITISFK